jgi:hypothetical protein
VTTPESDWAGLFGALSRSGRRIALVVTGGGSGAVARCFGRPGASLNFVEAVIPYSHAALIEYLGGPPLESSVSRCVAAELAAVARRRAARLGDDSTVPEAAAGIALTAALPTTPPRRGRDRIHLALDSQACCETWSLELAEGVHTRASAEAIAEEMVFLAIARLTRQATNQSYFQQRGLPLVHDRSQA